MKKTTQSLLFMFIILWAHLIHAAKTTSTDLPINPWNGFYLGANAGGWWSSSNTINTVGSPQFADPGSEPGSSIIESILVTIGTNKLSINSNGFIGGGQIGYNRALNKQFIVGLDADMDGMTQSSTNAYLNNVLTVGLRTYNSTVSVSKQINYLGTLRGRLRARASKFKSLTPFLYIRHKDQLFVFFGAQKTLSQTLFLINSTPNAA